MLEIVEPKSPKQFDAVRELCWEYRDFLIDLGGENARAVSIAYPEDKYARLMNTLEQHHAPPQGGVRLALLDDKPVGCGMFQNLLPDTAEIKRVYVRDTARGTGAGRAIMEALVSDCRDRGYARILMDTGKVLTAARGLYNSMGFVEREPYHDLHLSAGDLLVYFEMELRS